MDISSTTRRNAMKNGKGFQPLDEYANDLGIVVNDKSTTTVLEVSLLGPAHESFTTGEIGGRFAAAVARSKMAERLSAVAVATLRDVSMKKADRLGKDRDVKVVAVPLTFEVDKDRQNVSDPATWNGYPYIVVDDAWSRVAEMLFVLLSQTLDPEVTVSVAVRYFVDEQGAAKPAKVPGYTFARGDFVPLP